MSALTLIQATVEPGHKFKGLLAQIVWDLGWPRVQLPFNETAVRGEDFPGLPNTVVRYPNQNAGQVYVELVHHPDNTGLKFGVYKAETAGGKRSSVIHEQSVDAKDWSTVRTQCKALWNKYKHLVHTATATVEPGAGSHEESVQRVAAMLQSLGLLKHKQFAAYETPRLGEFQSVNVPWVRLPGDHGFLTLVFRIGKSMDFTQVEVHFPGVNGGDVIFQGFRANISTLVAWFTRLNAAVQAEDWVQAVRVLNTNTHGRGTGQLHVRLTRLASVALATVEPGNQADIKKIVSAAAYESAGFRVERTSIPDEVYLRDECDSHVIEFTVIYEGPVHRRGVSITVETVEYDEDYEEVVGQKSEDLYQGRLTPTVMLVLRSKTRLVKVLNRLDSMNLQVDSDGSIDTNLNSIKAWLHEEFN